MKKYVLAILVLAVLGTAYFWITRPFIVIEAEAKDEAYFVVYAIDIAGSEAAGHGAPPSVDTIPELLEYFEANPDLKLDPDHRLMLEVEGEYYRQSDFSWTYSPDRSESRVALVRIQANPDASAPAWTVVLKAGEPGKKQSYQWAVAAESD